VGIDYTSAATQREGIGRATRELVGAMLRLPDCPNSVTPSGIVFVPSAPPIHASEWGWASATVTTGAPRSDAGVVADMNGGVELPATAELTLS